MDAGGESCNACGVAGTALMKLSLGKDFFGRAYDRLSPSTDQSPKWYCEQCSMQKNLQRDFHDILQIEPLGLLLEARMQGLRPQLRAEPGRVGIESDSRPVHGFPIAAAFREERAGARGEPVERHHLHDAV